MTRGRAVKAFVALMTVLIVSGMVVPVAMAASTEPIGDNVNVGEWDEEETGPHPIFKVDVTTSSQDLSQGTTHTDIAGYEDDAGDWIAGEDTPFVVNTSHDIDDGGNVNPYSFNPAHIDDSGLQEFPEGHDADDDWLNSSSDVWVLSDGGATNLSVTETSVASGVPAIRFDTGTSGNSGNGISDGTLMYEASYNQSESGEDSGSLSVDTDENKRVLLVGGDLDTLETNAEVQIRVYDESGSYKEIVANDSGTAFSGNTFADSTGSFFYQVKLNTLTTQGTDSTFDNIENISIRTVASGTSDADSDITISALDLRRKALLTLGEQRATTDDDGNDADDDGDYDEFQTITNASGDISVHSMETLDSEFDDAVINELTYPAHFETAGLDQLGEDGDYIFEYQNASNPSFDTELNMTVQLKLPSVIDLSYSNAELNMTQKWNEDRYLTLSTAEDVADSKDLSEVDTSSAKDSLDSQGDEISLDSSVTAGDNYVMHYVIQLTDAEASVLQDTAADDDDDSGVAAPPAGEDGGILSGIWSFVTTIPGAVITVLGGFGIFQWWRRRGA